MRITDISPTKKGRFSVYIDGEFYGVLHADLYALSHLKPDDDVPQDKLDELISESELMITKERAMRLLSARAYTAQEMYEKLLRYSDEESAATAVRRMQELGLVDDLDYARRYAADCVNLKGFSYARTRRALREKGIKRAVIDEAMQDMAEDPETLIARFVLKKYAKYLATEDGRKKIIDALHRRGFYYADARRVIDNLLEDEGYYDDAPEE